MEQQQRMKIMKDLTKKSDQKEECLLEADGRLLSCWRQTVRKRGSIRDGCRSGMSGQRNEKKKRLKESWKNCINKR